MNDYDLLRFPNLFGVSSDDINFKCGDRQCDHDDDGPIVDLDGQGKSASCSKCGELAINISLMRGD